MLKDFRTSNLLELRNDLKHGLELVQSALNVRAQLLEYKSFASLESQRIDSEHDPESYYFFKFLDKAVSVVGDTIEVDSDGRHRKRSDRFIYHVKVYGWTSKIATSRIYNLPFSPNNRYYGNFYSLDEALSFFKKLVAELLGVLGINYQMCLF